MFVIHKRLSFDCDINIQCSVFKVTVSSCNVREIFRQLLRRREDSIQFRLYCSNEDSGMRVNAWKRHPDVTGSSKRSNGESKTSMIKMYGSKARGGSKIKRRAASKGTGNRDEENETRKEKHRGRKQRLEEGKRKR